MSESIKDPAVEHETAPEVKPELNAEQQAWLVKRDAKMVRSMYSNVASIVLLLGALISSAITQREETAYFNGEPNSYMFWVNFVVFMAGAVAVTIIAKFIRYYLSGKKLGKFPVGKVEDEPKPPNKIMVPDLLIVLLETALIVTWGITVFSW